MTDDALRDEFRRRFGVEPRISRAPGRVNLIGEHTDYNDGFVLPVAIQRSTRVAFAPLDQADVLVRSSAFEDDEDVRITLGERGERREHWSDYVHGVVRVLEDAAVSIRPAALLIDSDVPLGSGLSSSASLEVATANAFLSLCGVFMSPEDVALACQRAENEFVGTQCGIMDQFIACLGREGHALLLDCRSRETSFVPIPRSLEILVMNSGVRHALADGEYNLRRAECLRAVDGIRARAPAVRSLRDVTAVDLEGARRGLDDVAFRRARHVVTENARVLALAEALRRDDSAAIGLAMAASHESLRTDFEVSCAELDLLVDLATAHSDVVGARMTGGGFGGCTVNLVRAGQGALISRTVSADYEKETGRRAQMWVTTADGAAQVA